MMGAMTPTPVTNEAVGQRLGLTHSAISRIRSGGRMPSFQTMVLIAKEYGWPIEDQTEARLLDQYAREFERVITRVHQAAAS